MEDEQWAHVFGCFLLLQRVVVMNPGMLDSGLNLRPFDKLPPSHEASYFAKATADKTVGRHGRQAQARECGAEKSNFYSFCAFIARPKGSWQSRDRFTLATVRDDTNIWRPVTSILFRI